MSAAVFRRCHENKIIVVTKFFLRYNDRVTFIQLRMAGHCEKLDGIILIRFLRFSETN